MKIIKSQEVSEPLTHVLHQREDYEGIKKNGFKITIHQHESVWKPNALWISVDHDWEQWCYLSGWGEIERGFVCDVSLKDDLKLIKITSIEDAEEMAEILMPDFDATSDLPKMFSDLPEFKPKKSDMLTMTMYLIDSYKRGIKVTPGSTWEALAEKYDGIYFRNSMSLHFDTFFNTWDAHSIALFDAKNATFSNPRGAREIVELHNSWKDS